MQKGLIAVLLGLLIFVPVTSFAAIEISDGSVQLLWHLDGDGVDSSGNGLNGNEANAVYSSSILDTAIDGGSSNTNRSVYRDGNAPAGLSLSQLQTAWSIAFWVNVTADSSDSYAISNQSQTGSNQRAVVGVNLASGNLRLVIYDGSVNVYTIRSSYTSSPGTGVWTHYVVTYNGTHFEVYENGNLTPILNQARTIGAASDSSAGGFSVISQRVGGSLFGYFNGLVDEAVVFDTVISSSTITALYNSGSGDTVCTDVGCADVVSQGVLFPYEKDSYFYSLFVLLLLLITFILILYSNGRS